MSGIFHRDLDDRRVTLESSFDDIEGMGESGAISSNKGGCQIVK